jgi:hypothetical protein
MADGVEVKNDDGRYLISMDGRYAALQRGDLRRAALGGPQGLGSPIASGKTIEPRTVCRSRKPTFREP